MKSVPIGKLSFYSLIPVSILTGTLTHIGTVIHQENLCNYLYYFGEQLSELLLLIVIVTGYKPYKKWTYSLVALCGAEMWDETLGRNLEFNVYDFVLIVVVLILVSIIFKKPKIDEGSTTNTDL